MLGFWGYNINFIGLLDKKIFKVYFKINLKEWLKGIWVWVEWEKKEEKDYI